jgi:hypothetical protein
MWLLDRLARGLKHESKGDNPQEDADTGATTLDAGKAPAPGERRKDARHGLGAPTMVMLPGEQSGVRAFIHDISKGGCLLDTDAQVHVGTRLSLAFLSKLCGHCHAVGSVVRVADKRRFGVQFSQVNMAFLGFVGSVSSASPQGRDELVAAMKGSTIEISSGP